MSMHDTARMALALMATVCLTLSLTARAGLPDIDSSLAATGRHDYLTTLEVGETRLEIEAVRRITRIEGKTGEELHVGTLTRTGMGLTDDRLQLNAETLLPLAREVYQGDGRMQIELSPDRVTGYIQAAGQTVSLDTVLTTTSYAAEAGLEVLLAALALEQDLVFELDLIEIDVHTQVRRYELRVGATETIEVPAGRFIAWPIEVTAVDDPGDRQTLWISQSQPRLFVRAEAPVPVDLGRGSLITELVRSGD